MARAAKQKPVEPQDTAMGAAPEGKVHRLRRMTDEQFARELQRLTDTYGTNRREAGEHFEREISDLYYRCHWTQAEIADRVGKSKHTVTRFLKFGRFLQGAGEFRKTVKMAFFQRAYYALIGTTPDEDECFNIILVTLRERQGLPESQQRLSQLLARKFQGDEGWHPMETIVEASGYEQPQVLANLLNMKYPGSRATRVEEKNIRGKRCFRFVPNEYVADSQLTKSRIVAKLDIIIGMLTTKTDCADVLEAVRELRRLLA